MRGSNDPPAAPQAQASGASAEADHVTCQPPRVVVDGIAQLGLRRGKTQQHVGPGVRRLQGPQQLRVARQPPPQRGIVHVRLDRRRPTLPNLPVHHPRSKLAMRGKCSHPAVRRGRVYASIVNVVVSFHGGDDAVTELDASLRSNPALADVRVRRGRAEIRPGQLGAGEVLTFLATDVALPVVLTAIYDFFKARRRSRPAEQARVVLTRTDLPDGTRQTELRLEGPMDAAVAAVQSALDEAPPPGR
jgi:hypothetical protein